MEAKSELKLDVEYCMSNKHERFNDKIKILLNLIYSKCCFILKLKGRLILKAFIMLIGK